MAFLVALLAGGLAAYPITMADGHETVYVLAAVGVLAGLAAASGRRTWAYVAATILMLGYLDALILADEVLDVAAPLYGVGLYLLLEAAESRRTVRMRSVTVADVTTARAVFVLGILVAGGATSVTALWLGGAAPTSGPVAFSLAVIAALGALMVIVLATVRALDRGGSSGG
jgi:hypothetical protein